METASIAFVHSGHAPKDGWFFGVPDCCIEQRERSLPVVKMALGQRP